MTIRSHLRRRRLQFWGALARWMILGLFFASSSAWACWATPREQTSPPDDLIARTKDIALAKVVRADAGSDPWRVLYTFKTERAIKGVPPRAFQLLGKRLLGDLSTERFDEHQAAGFWDEYGGRQRHDTTCEITPSFIVGATYLIFLDAPYHNKSFEEIYYKGDEYSDKDKWLKYVEDKVADSKK